jgi:hypothetical protein
VQIHLLGSPFPSDRLKAQDGNPPGAACAVAVRVADDRFRRDLPSRRSNFPGRFKIDRPRQTNWRFDACQAQEPDAAAIKCSIRFLCDVRDRFSR